MIDINPVWYEHKDGWIRDSEGNIIMSSAEFHSSTKKIPIKTRAVDRPYDTIFDPLKFMPNVKHRLSKSHKIYE